MPKNDFLYFVDDVFALPDGDIKLLRQRFETNPINQPALDDLPVPLCVAAYHILVNDSAKLSLAVISHTA